VGLATAAFVEEDEQQDETALLAAAIALNAGAIGGAFAAGPVSPTIARVRFLDLGGIAGGLTFGGLYVAGADRNADGQGFFGATAAGIATGLVTAWFATRNMTLDRFEPKSDAESADALVVRPSLSPVRGGAVLGLAGSL
jgi:hypothetical protein